MNSNKLIFILFQNVQRQVERDPVKATREDINGPTRSHRKNKFSDPKTRVIVVKKITREKIYTWYATREIHVYSQTQIKHVSDDEECGGVVGQPAAGDAAGRPGGAGLRHPRDTLPRL